MTAPWRQAQRRRDAARRHQVDTRPTPEAVGVVPDHIAWKVRLGDTVAHAFSSGSGWMRSVCRAERWTVALADAGADVETCGECALLVDGAPGEITEAFGS